jgi:hypothetical protein
LEDCIPNLEPHGRRALSPPEGERATPGVDELNP